MGLAVDLFLTTPLGLSALAFAVTGLRGGRVPDRAWCARTPWLAPILGGIGGLFGGLVFITAGAVVGPDGDALVRQPADRDHRRILDAVIAPIVFPLVRRAARRDDAPTSWRIR